MLCLMLSICVSEAMKKYLIPVAAVAVAAVLGTPYYLGIKAEESLTATGGNGSG